MSQVLECKQMYAEGVSIRRIAKVLGLARNTVRRQVRGDVQAGEYKQTGPRQQPVREGIAPRVRELLESEASRGTPRKQRLTAARIFRILEREGAHVSESTVRKLVRGLRLELRDPLRHAYLPLEYRPGEDGQVDFFEAVVDDRRLGRIKVFVLLVRACFSGKCYAYAAPNQTREALLEGLMQAFEYFGGIFRVLWFDNLTPAVRKVLKGRTRELQHAFASFQAHNGFRAEFCAPGKGNEKGGVEGLVKFARHEILSPIPVVDGRADVQALCGEYMERERLRTMRGRAQTIDEMWDLETTELLPLPGARFKVAVPRKAKVANRSWIQSGTNFYSVPVAWVGHVVTLEVEAEQVTILGPKDARVVHARMYGQHEASLELDHYLPLLERKHRGLDRAAQVRRFLERVDACWSVLLAQFRRRDGEVAGSRSFIDVLLLGREHGVERVTEAVRLALGHPEVSVGVVRFHLRDQLEQAAPSQQVIEYAGPRVEVGSPSDYAVLTGPQEVLHA